MEDKGKVFSYIDRCNMEGGSQEEGHQSLDSHHGYHEG
jgi:hypothetical protein